MGQCIHSTSVFPPQEFCHQFITQWKKLNLDVMLCPMLGPALRIGYPEKLSGRTANLYHHHEPVAALRSIRPPTPPRHWPVVGRALLLGQLQPQPVGYTQGPPCDAYGSQGADVHPAALEFPAQVSC